MTARRIFFAVVAIGVFLANPSLNNIKGQPEPQQQQVRRNVRYTCNGETIVVSRCRHDSDMQGYPPTKPEDDYCAVHYPDRPLQNGISVEKVELLSDVVKKLQSCGAFNQPSRQPVASTAAAPGSAKTGSASGTSRRPPEVITRADKLYDDKKYLEAIEEYKKAVVLKLDNPTLARAHNRMGYAYYELKQNENSLLHLREAIRFNPEDPSTNFGLGFIHYNLKQYPQALAAFQKTIKLNPSNADYQYWVGETYLVGLEQGDKAIPYFRESLRLRPKDTRTLGELAAAYYFDRDDSAAIAAFKEAIRLKPSPALYYGLGLAYLSNGQKDDALLVYYILQTLDPKKAKELSDRINK